MLFLLVFNRALLLAEGDIHVRLRLAWGGAIRQWQTTVSVSSGSLSSPQRLGLEPDTPGSTWLAGNVLHVEQRSPRVYDGVDLDVVAPPTAKLQVSVKPTDGQLSDDYFEEITLSHLVADNHSAKLDGQNHLLIQRAPGDRMRVHFDRPSLVFHPYENFKFSIDPHLIEVASGSSVTCAIELLRARTDEEVWSHDETMRVGDTGEIPSPAEIDMVLPAEEGVYDLLVRLTTKRLATAFRPVEVARRRVQVVVVLPKPGLGENGEWSERVTIDPGNPDWWERINLPAAWNLLPWARQRPPQHGEVTTGDHDGQIVSRLEPGAWTAYPLPVSDPGRPHLLEVEYPADVQQTLGISIVEPDAAGAVLPIGLDSGVDVPRASDVPSRGKHRLVFWPKTKTPLVLLTNRGQRGPAVYGRIRLLAGPASLPPAAASRGRQGDRLLALFFDKPLFPENFSATKRLDQSSSRSLDDWVTFYDGAIRLVEYMKHVGYNAAVISVVCEGSTIYPSELLEPTPKYDSGAFFASGQDPIQKDVLELLFRMFDREGLQLIPSLHYSTPLPSLESARRTSGGGQGIDLLNREGQRWQDVRGTHQGLAPYYNPLHEQVQTAMSEVIGEIAERYAQHPSFAGIALQLGKDTYAQLPSGDWGYDPHTVRRFAADTRQRDFPIRHGDQVEHLYGDGRAEWLQWRGRELAQLHRRLRNEIARRKPNGRLFLTAADVFASRHVRTALQPKLPSRVHLDEVLLEVGLQPELHRDDPSIVMPRPRRDAPLLSLWSQQVNLFLRDADEVDRAFTDNLSPASIFYHESQPLRLKSFDEKSPFNKQKTHAWLEAHITPHGYYNRQRFAHAVATSDVQIMMDGGWLVSLGQEDAIRHLLEVYRRLPARKFRTVNAATSADDRHGVVVRSLPTRSETFAYIVNDAPWPARVHLQVQAPSGCHMWSLSQRELPHLRGGRGLQGWTLDLEPYDLVGAVFTSPLTDIVDWNVEIRPEVKANLQFQIRDIRRRADALANPPSLDLLANPGFDDPPQRAEIPGWVHAWGRALEVTTDNTKSHQGKRSLRVTNADNRSVAWIRSDPFSPPATGRISVQVWLRIDDEDKQPTLRLAIEGVLDGKPYYRYAKVGTGGKSPQLKSSWEKYIFQVDDLPIGLRDVRVGFDLMDRGRVWIDDVEVFDRWFRDNEERELVKRIAFAALQLHDGETQQCQKFLDSYWPQFLRRHVPLETADGPNPAARTAHRQFESTPHDSPSVLDRVRGLVPGKVFPF